MERGPAVTAAARTPPSRRRRIATAVADLLAPDLVLVRSPTRARRTARTAVLVAWGALGVLLLGMAGVDHARGGLRFAAMAVGSLAFFSALAAAAVALVCVSVDNGRRIAQRRRRRARQR